MDFIRWLLGTGRTTYFEAQARKDAEIYAARWGWAKGLGRGVDFILVKPISETARTFLEESIKSRSTVGISKRIYRLS